MSIYTTLGHLSAALAPIAASAESHQARHINAHRLFWHAAGSVSDALTDDISTRLKSRAFVHAVEFYFLDPFFRQSSTTIVFMVKFAEDPDLILRIECLVDHGTVVLSVRRQPEGRSPLTAVAEHIMRSYPPGAFEVALQDLPPFEPHSRYWR